LIIAREFNDRRAEGNALGSLGVTFAYLKDFDRAIDSLKEQLAVVHGLGDRQTELSVLGNLGNIYYRINDLEGIAVIYDQIVSLSREEQLDKPNR
jgi:tetratricopeptide (TPR) repeat protein